MFLINPQGLGEQALNKIAELALQSQFEQVQHLAVRVKTDPNLLAQGRLESLAIDGVGLVMQRNLRMQEMRIQMGEIAVSPLKALMGNIQLTQPSQGKANFVLTEANFNRALNQKPLYDAMNRLDLKLGERSVRVVPESIRCRFGQGTIAIALQLQDLETRQVYPVTLEATPKLSPGRGIQLASPQYQCDREPSPQLTRLGLKAVEEIANLRNFEIPGLSLHIEQFQLETGQLRLQAIAKMTHFPSNRS